MTFFSYIKPKSTLKTTQRATGSGSACRDAPWPPQKRSPGSSPAGILESHALPGMPKRLESQPIPTATTTVHRCYLHRFWIQISVEGVGTGGLRAERSPLLHRGEKNTKASAIGQWVPSLLAKNTSKAFLCCFSIFFLKPPQLEASGCTSPGSAVGAG